MNFLCCSGDTAQLNNQDEIINEKEKREEVNKFRQNQKKNCKKNSYDQRSRKQSQETELPIDKRPKKISMLDDELENENNEFSQ